LYNILDNMNKLVSIFEEIKKQINYIINDKEIIYSNNYFLCLDELYKVLIKTLYKIQNIYYKYILYSKLQKT